MGSGDRGVCALNVVRCNVTSVNFFWIDQMLLVERLATAVLVSPCCFIFLALFSVEHLKVEKMWACGEMAILLVGVHL